MFQRCKDRTKRCRTRIARFTGSSQTSLFKWVILQRETELEVRLLQHTAIYIIFYSKQGKQENGKIKYKIMLS